MLAATISAVRNQASSRSLICAAILAGSSLVQADSFDWYIDAINTPQIEASADEGDVILIAIVDDGFRLSSGPERLCLE